MLEAAQRVQQLQARVPQSLERAARQQLAAQRPACPGTLQAQQLTAPLGDVPGVALQA